MFFFFTFLIFQFQSIFTTFPDNDNSLVISPHVMAQIRRIAVCTHLCKSSTSYTYILRLCGKTTTCYFFIAEKLLLCRTCTYWGMGRRDDAYEWWQLLKNFILEIDIFNITQINIP